MTSMVLLGSDFQQVYLSYSAKCPHATPPWASHFDSQFGGENNADETVELTRLCRWQGTPIIHCHNAKPSGR